MSAVQRVDASWQYGGESGDDATIAAQNCNGTRLKIGAAPPKRWLLDQSGFEAAFVPPRHAA
ncbi:hypothetical protein FJW07_19075 [Mesorhizobium sp. B3-1-9]|uniref:hypothetical protein n=1 Tax=Mesorhizobium sp. B3-1-9 TaxID=2589892 RepID=UPI001125C746|nr:hypothetical protein [Mesorhizobium sp. B3-1-9]TPI37199.1 hypothetical protein FJW07_19075 [Mesorhizobium sp. B3-1-9]